MKPLLLSHTYNIHFATFTLHDVLCALSFKINMISISKLVHNFHYLTTFTNDDCILHDQRLRKMIGTKIKQGGFYDLDTPQKNEM